MVDELDGLALEALQESALNRRKDLHNRRCPPDEIQSTSIEALLRYCGALRDLIREMEYVDGA